MPRIRVLINVDRASLYCFGCGAETNFSCLPGRSLADGAYEMNIECQCPKVIYAEQEDKKAEEARVSLLARGAFRD